MIKKSESCVCMCGKISFSLITKKLQAKGKKGEAWKIVAGNIIENRAHFLLRWIGALIEEVIENHSLHIHMLNIDLEVNTLVNVY